MKKAIPGAALCFMGVVVLAQNPVLPKPESPNPKNLRLLGLPDLTIPEIRLIESVFDGDKKAWKLKVAVTIKNVGELKAAKTILKPTARKENTATSTWKDFGYTVAFIPVNPGESITREFIFIDHLRSVGDKGNFYFKMIAHSGNEIAEADENNNSRIILISRN